MPIIDAHTHVFSPDVIADRETYRQRDRWFGLLYANPRARLAGADELIVSMASARVDQSICFGFAFADQGLCRAENDYALDSAARYPEQLLPFALVSPRAGEEALREGRRCLESGALGLGELMPDGQGFGLTDYGLLDPLMALARAYDVPVMFHVNEQVGHDYPGKGEQGSSQAFALAARYPENRLILSHWGAGLPFYELMPEVRAVLRNVYYDTAASIYLYDDAIFRHVMAWAPTKVLFGSDYPLITQRRFLRRVRGVGLVDAAFEALLGANTARLLERELHAGYEAQDSHGSG